MIRLRQADRIRYRSNQYVITVRSKTNPDAYLVINQRKVVIIAKDMYIFPNDYPIKKYYFIKKKGKETFQSTVKIYNNVTVFDLYTFPTDLLHSICSI